MTNWILHGCLKCGGDICREGDEFICLQCGGTKVTQEKDRPKLERTKRPYTRRSKPHQAITTTKPTDELEWLRGYRQAILDILGNKKG